MTNMFSVRTTLRRLGLVMATLAVACSAGGPAVAVAFPSTQPSTPYYVALGDSRSTTATWSALLTDGCGANAEAFPAMVAERLGVRLTSRSCAGATTSNVLRTPQLTLHGFRPPQIDAVTRDTRLVTVSIGGNDLNWWSLVYSCFTFQFGMDARCRSNTVVAQQIRTKLTALRPRIDQMLRAIRQRAPHAQIILLGHGGYYGPTGCPGQAQISPLDAAFVLNFFSRFNAVLRAATTAASDDFVDVAGPARHHDACAAPAERWFLGNQQIGDNAQRHPTARGREEMAELVLARVRR